MLIYSLIHKYVKRRFPFNIGKEISKLNAPFLNFFAPSLPSSPTFFLSLHAAFKFNLSSADEGGGGGKKKMKRKLFSKMCSKDLKYAIATCQTKQNSEEEKKIILNFFL